MGRVIGMDPHKRSATVEIINSRERVLAQGRFGTSNHSQMISPRVANRQVDRYRQPAPRGAVFGLYPAGGTKPAQRQGRSTGLARGPGHMSEATEPTVRAARRPRRRQRRAATALRPNASTASVTC